ncbi:MAG: family peptidase [Cyanobacteriota bacterium erpe_2018_sw_21hr_WHONDRS-SW48-000092_B_bin.40]|jgi:predicted Zn-dependent protease|nr:family peptidase [Cyanobacteriota bacterium erpe_2018_sw_21hr_WHONDRS-SW48-000092_B_bin.40]
MAQQQQSGPSISPRILIALVIAAFSLISYFGSSFYNPITEQKQHLDMTPNQEIALGLQAAPEMAQQYGGQARDRAGQTAVDQIGQELVTKTDAGKTPYQYHFHLLADDSTVNAFALPGGQIFITEGLYKNLKTKGELACVLAHEVGHVAARHSAQQLAKQQLTQGLTGAAVIAAYDPNDRNNNTAAMAMLISQVVSLKFGRNDELEADRLGVRFSQQAGYDPRSMIKVMEILDHLSKSRTLEFFSTHPNPDNRIKKITAEIASRFPNGVPNGLVR